MSAEENAGEERGSGVRLVTSQLTKVFGSRLVLAGVDLEARPGEVLAVVGRSGCGKTTLLRILAGLDRPSAGDVALGGRRGAGPRAEVRMVFQEPRLLPWKTVGQNVGLGLPPGGADREETIAAALDQVGLGARARDWPAVLSGGQKQRVALARALVSRPRLLLLDEPLGALDALTRLEMQRLIERLCTSAGFTVVLVTHDVHEAVALADRIVVLDEGRVALNLPVLLPRPHSRSSAGFSTLVSRVLEYLLADDADGPADLADNRRKELHEPDAPDFSLHPGHHLGSGRGRVPV